MIKFIWRAALALVAAASLYLAGASTATAAEQEYAGKGEVIALEPQSARIKLKHEAVRELNWPGMTMFFKVADAAMLSKLKIGDNVEFRFVSRKGEAPVVTQIQPRKNQ